MNASCLEPGCDRIDLYGRGLCGKHYQFYRYHKRLDEIAPRPEMRSCAHCGGRIKATLRQWSAAFCSSRCSHAAKYELVRSSRKHFTCEQCGADMDGRRVDARFCSTKCGSGFRNARTKAILRANRKPCAHCGKPIPLNRHRFCSDTCNMAHRRPEKYGLSRAELEALLAQHSVCAICGTDRWGRKGPQVDHNHATGAVRGILCVNCNTLLGHSGDDPDRLLAAAKYLRL